jgi:hypothetical protein
MSVTKVHHLNAATMGPRAPAFLLGQKDATALDAALAQAGRRARLRDRTARWAHWRTLDEVAKR